MRYFSANLLRGVALSIVMSTGASTAVSQQCNIIEVWVDPDQGHDIAPPPPTNPPTHVPIQINNPHAPTLTINFAIAIASDYLRSSYDAQTNADQQAVIHLLPGIYGPVAAGGNGETFPINMADRVHVRGVSARRCVVRGNGSQLTKIYWPSQGSCGSGSPPGFRDREVLVNFSASGRFSRNVLGELPPWACNPNFEETIELLDSVTLQGGEVQVYFGWQLTELPVPLSARISNCLFDMRNGFAVEAGPALLGPKIGVLMAKTWTDEDAWGGIATGSGYMDQKVHIVNNTFVMAEFVKDPLPSQTGWFYKAVPGAVGVMDATYGICGSTSVGDPVKTIRGVGHPGIQNNVFRTFTTGAPANLNAMAMVGITADDAVLQVGPKDTNAYCVDRSGYLSAVPGAPDESMISYPVASTQTGLVDLGAGNCSMPGVILEPLWNGNPLSPVPAPGSPAVKTWDGNTTLGPQSDPAFVGEYLRTVTPVKNTYRDWRLLPGSPLKDQGRWDGVNAFANGEGYPELSCDMLKVALWDSESYGSPRIIDTNPDIGFDELHLAVVCGSYSNHCFSHNLAAYLNPFVQSEQNTRFALVPKFAAQQALAGRTLRFLSNERVPPQPQDNGPAWTIPPGSLTAPAIQPASPAGYNLLYTTTGNPLSWAQGFSSILGLSLEVPFPNWQGAPNMTPFAFYQVQLPQDNEGAGFASWVNLQPLVTQPGGGAAVLWGNMQPEFR